MASKWEIDRWVEEKAQNPFFSFYPSLPAKELGIDLAEAFIRLLALVDDGRLTCKYEVRCPDCYSTALSVDVKPHSDFNQYCERCDVNFDVAPEMLIPVFAFAGDYAESVKKKIIH